MDVLQTIKNDHLKICVAFSNVNASGKIVEFRKRLEYLSEVLKFQLSLEHDHIYPEVLAAAKGSERQIEQCIGSQKKLLKALKSLEKDVNAKPPLVKAKLDEVVTSFCESLALHFKLEEEVVMPRLRDNIATLDREDLGQLIEDLKVDSHIFESIEDDSALGHAKTESFSMSVIA